MARANRRRRGAAAIDTRWMMSIGADLAADALPGRAQREGPSRRLRQRGAFKGGFGRKSDRPVVKKTRLSGAVLRWARLGSNQRPLACEEGEEGVVRPLSACSCGLSAFRKWGLGLDSRRFGPVWAQKSKLCPNGCERGHCRVQHRTAQDRGDRLSAGSMPARRGCAEPARRGARVPGRPRWAM